MKTSGDQWRDKWRYPLLSRLNNDDFKIMNFQTLRSIKRPPGVSIETVVEALEPPGKSRLSIETGYLSLRCLVCWFLSTGKQKQMNAFCFSIASNTQLREHSLLSGYLVVDWTDNWWLVSLVFELP